MTPFFPTPDYQQIAKNFLSELTSASQNKQSSLSFIKNTFPTQPLVQRGLVQVFVIGGTNYETSKATIAPDGSITELENGRKTEKVPKFLDKHSFIHFIENLIDPACTAIAINFAWPIEPTKGSFGELDGILIHGTKEHLFEGLLGKAIGATIKKAINFDKPITVVNDTVCLGQNGLVVGSGFNICLNSTNLEAGSFNDFPPTDELEIIDHISKNKGYGRFEKMLSGNYLPLQYNLLAKNHQSGLPHLVSGKELTKLAETDGTEAGDLARALLNRSARLVAAAIAGAYLFLNEDKLTFQTDGSLFWKGWEYKKTVEEALATLGVPQGSITFSYKKDIAIKGAFTLFTRTK